MEIVLIRHGRPDFLARPLGKHNPPATALQRYKASEVTDSPPEQLLQLARKTGVCITSKLERSMTSASLLEKESIKSTELLNESELPHPNQLCVPVPWPAFLILSRLLWFTGYRRNCPGRQEDLKRAKRASEYLCNAVAHDNCLLAIGHGIMNRMICAELKKSGWSVVNTSGTGYWSTITLRLDPDFHSVDGISPDL